MYFHTHNIGLWLKRLTIVLYLLLIIAPIMALAIYAFKPVTVPGMADQEVRSGIWWVLMSPGYNANGIFDVNKLIVLFGAVTIAVKVVLLSLVLSLPLTLFFLTIPRVRRTQAILLFGLPIWVSPFIKTILWVDLINWLPLSTLDNQHILIFVISANMLPIMTVVMLASLELINHNLMETARDLYTSRLKIFQYFIAPRLLIGALTGMMLVLIPSLMAFYEPLVIGTDKAISLGIWVEQLAHNRFQLPIAATYSSLIILATLVLCRLDIVHKMTRALL